MCYEHHLSFSLFVAGGVEVAVSLFMAGAVFGDLGLSLLQHEFGCSAHCTGGFVCDEYGVVRSIV